MSRVEWAEKERHRAWATSAGRWQNSYVILPALDEFYGKKHAE
jgi:hypothetical protein